MALCEDARMSDSRRHAVRLYAPATLTPSFAKILDAVR